MSGPKPAPEQSRAGRGDDLPARLARRLQALIPADARASWVVAFSGGIDSLALLAALQSLVRAQPASRRAALRAVHVDHGLQPRSRAWAAHCRRTCKQLGVPLTVRRARLAPPRGASLEALARDARYRLLGEGLRTGEVLLTAHHVDDQLETMLLQLMRGAGVAGLAAMPPVARFGRGWLLRPLLDTGRSELEAWVRARGLGWVEDDSNADERFDRNYLRRRVIPALTQRWSAAAVVAARSAAHLAEARAVLEDVAAADLAALRRGRALHVAALQALPAARRRLAVRAWLRGLGLPLPDARHLARVVGELCVARRDAQPCVRWSGAEVRRHDGRLYAFASLPEPAAAGAHGWSWRGARPLELGPGLGQLVLRRDPAGALDAARLPARLRLCWRQGGERLRTEAGGPRRTLKEWLRVRGVLPWMRERLPLLYAGNELVAVADLAVDAAYAAGPRSRSRCRIEWRDAPECCDAARQPRHRPSAIRHLGDPGEAVLALDVEHVP